MNCRKEKIMQFIMLLLHNVQLCVVAEPVYLLDLILRTTFQWHVMNTLDELQVNILHSANKS